MLFLPEGSQELKERVRGHDDDDDDDGDDDDDDDDDNDDGDGVWMRRLNTQHKTLMIQMLRIFSGTVSLMYMFLTTSWGEDGSWKRSQIIGVWIGLSSCLKAVFRSDLIHVPGRDPELQCEPSLWDKRRKIWDKRRSEVSLKPSNSETGLMFRVDEPWSRIRRSRLSTRKEPKETWGSFSVKEIKRELITGGGYQSLSVSPRHNPGFPDLQPSSPRSLRSAQPSLIFLKQGNPRPDELRGGSRSSSAS